LSVSFISSLTSGIKLIGFNSKIREKVSSPNKGKEEKEGIVLDRKLGQIILGHRIKITDERITCPNTNHP